MDLSEFQNLPDQARVWVHCFEQELSEQQQEIIQRGLEEFLPQWVSHGTPVKAAFKILSGHFVVTAAYSQEGVSGCSMDSLLRNFKTFKTVYGLDGLKGGLLFYRDKEGKISGGGSAQVSGSHGIGRNHFRDPGLSNPPEQLGAAALRWF